jgi:hypothetical protein
MATLITKNSSTASSIPTAAQLVQGELAVNVADKRIFTENSAGAVVELGTNPSSVTTGTLTTTGNVGVGTSTPGNKLSVIGDARLSLTTTGTSYPLLLENSNTTGVVAAAIAFQNNGTTKASIQAGVFGNDFMTFNVGSNTERVRIDASGNVGIGTSSPGSKFAVGNATDQVQAGISGAVSIIYLGTPNTSSGGQSTLSYNRANGTTSIGSSSAGVSLGSAINVDSNGNVGIGTSSPGAKLDVTVGGANLAQQLVGTSGVYSRIGTASSSFYTIHNGTTDTFLYTAEASALRFGTNSTERMRIDSAGNLGIGTSSPGYKLSVHTTTGGGFNMTNGVDSTLRILMPSVGITYDNVNGGYHAWQISGTERARIDSSGNLLVGTTSNTIAGPGPGQLACLSTTAGKFALSLGNTAGSSAYGLGINSQTGENVYFYYQGVYKGAISTSAGGTTYSTSSDYRLKNTIEPMTGALDKVALLKPCTYKWNADGSDGQGFIAHQLAEVEPGCVSGEKDETETRTVETSPAIPAEFDAEGVETSPAVAAVTEEQVFPKYQGIDTSFLVATLAAAIQELKAIVDEQAVKIAALEAK